MNETLFDFRIWACEYLNQVEKLKSLKAITLILAAIQLATPLSVNTSVAAEPYHLGVALAISGPGALYCKDGTDAIKLAVREINARGGFLGTHPIVLHIKDTRTDAKVAAGVVEKLILEDRVRCVLGTYSSAAAITVKNLCRQHRVLHIPAISNSENITKLDFSPYTYQVVPNSFMQARATVLGIVQLAKAKGWQRYVTIASDYEWGRSTQKNAVGLLTKNMPGLKMVTSFWPPLGEDNFSTVIKEISRLAPDFIYGSLGSKDNLAWIKQANQYGLFQKIPYPGSLISVTELRVQAKSIPRGIIGICRAPFFAHLEIPMMADFVKAFRARYRRYPSDWAVLEYDAVQVLKQGIEKSGSIDSEEVRQALKGANVETCRGRLFFREVDNMLSCSSYLGVVADDARYNFPIYQDLVEIKGPDSWRPAVEILDARKGINP